MLRGKEVLGMTQLDNEFLKNTSTWSACVQISALINYAGSGGSHLIRRSRKRMDLYHNLGIIRYHYGYSKDMLFSVIRPFKVP